MTDIMQHLMEMSTFQTLNVLNFFKLLTMYSYFQNHSINIINLGVFCYPKSNKYINSRLVIYMLVLFNNRDSVTMMIMGKLG